MAATPPAWPTRDSAHLLVSSAQMAALEEQLFASGLPVEALMEKAALGVAARLRQHDWWPQLCQRGALVLVGPGHNGGDGLVVARELQLAGVPVRIWCPFARHKPLTAAHWRHALWLGIPALTEPPQAHDPAIWIDALFGIGQHRPLEPALAALLKARQRACPGALIAIDVPSGLCADRGETLGATAACAALTLSIGLIKQGLVQDSALAWVGQLERIELGLPAALLQSLPGEQPLLLGPADRGQAPWPALPPAAGKYARGRLLVLAGSDAYRGAAELCLQGANASGCGSLRAALPAAVAAELWQRHPHVVVSAALPSDADGALQLAALTPACLERLDAVVLGPGLGLGSQPAAATAGGDGAIWQALQQLPGLLLLDADGLNRLAARPDALPWLQGRRGPTWLTPHRGEFARLFPELAALPALEAARQAAGRSGCSVLLKGARTVVAAVDGRLWQLGCGTPQAARAGLGDVLAGFAAGRGAVAMAATGQADASQLAAAALEHSAAAHTAVHTRGAGQATPGAVAAALQLHTISGPNSNGSTTNATLAY